MTRNKINSRTMCLAQLICFLFALTLLMQSARSHPDLLLQIEVLDEKLQGQPSNVEWLIQRGDLYRRHLDYVAAASDFDAARLVEPENTLLDFYQGRLSLERGNPERAAHLLAHFLSSNPQHAMAWVLRGEASVDLNYFSAASGYFGQAISVAKAPSPDIYRQQVMSLLAIGMSEIAAAQKVVDSGINRFGTEVTLLGLGVDIALANSQTEKAEQYIALLPERLLMLPLWESRITTLSCLINMMGETKKKCLDQAKQVMDDQIRLFAH